MRHKAKVLWHKINYNLASPTHAYPKSPPSKISSFATTYTRIYHLLLIQQLKKKAIIKTYNNMDEDITQDQ